MKQQRKVSRMVVFKNLTEVSSNVLRNLCWKILFCSLANEGTVTQITKTNTVTQTKKFSFDGIVIVSFCILSYDCYVHKLLSGVVIL